MKSFNVVVDISSNVGSNSYEELRELDLGYFSAETCSLAVIEAMMMMIKQKLLKEGESIHMIHVGVPQDIH